MWRALALVAAATVLPTGGAVAEAAFVREPLRIPMAAAGPSGLEALLVRPDQPGRYPLALITHGTPRDPKERPRMTPLAYLPHAMEFARRGWAAVVVMRRSFGGSGGIHAEDNGRCNDRDYVGAGRASAADLTAAIRHLATRADIDPARVIAVGQSAGGLASVALTADPPPGLVAAISFAGGRGSVADDDVCQEDRLVDAFRVFGKRSRIPMLWVYAENDHFFRPALAQRFKDAFAAGGGNVEFVREAPHGQDGHFLFSPSASARWTPLFDAFLQRHDLALRETPLPLPAPPAVDAPARLNDSGRKAFSDYLVGPLHKAFAMSPQGSYGWQTAQRTIEEAKARALKRCRTYAGNCAVVMVDDGAQGRAKPEFTPGARAP
jgi:dienelactone hydrolase